MAAEQAVEQAVELPSSSTAAEKRAAKRHTSAAAQTAAERIAVHSLAFCSAEQTLRSVLHCHHVYCSAHSFSTSAPLQISGVLMLSQVLFPEVLNRSLPAALDFELVAADAD